MLGLALGQRDFNLHVASLVVQVQGHQGVTLLLGLANQSADLGTMHQQFFDAIGLGPNVSRRRPQGIDAQTDQKQLAFLDHDIAIGQLHLAFANGLDFPALQHNAGLEALFDVIVEMGFPVFCDRHVVECAR